MSQAEGVPGTERIGNFTIKTTDSGRTLDVNGRRFPNLTMLREKAKGGNLFYTSLYGEYDSTETPVIYDADAWRFAQEYFSESSYTQEGDKEDGAVLLGHFKKDPKTSLDYTEVLYVVPLQYFIRRGGSLTFTADAWSYFNKIKDTANGFFNLPAEEELIAVGWLHTHPELGVFLSKQDADVNRHWEQDPKMIAAVMDPRQREDLTPDIGTFSKLGKGQPESSDPRWRKHKGVWTASGIRGDKCSNISNEQLTRIEEIAEAREQIRFLRPEAELVTSIEPAVKPTVGRPAETKEAEWQPKVKPFDLVFPYVVAEIKKTGGLSLETRVMLYAWAGQIIELSSQETGKKVKVDVNTLINGYGGIPEQLPETSLPRLGYYLEAVDNLVRSKIASNKIDKETLSLLMPWLDCPMAVSDKKTVADIIRQRMAVGNQLISSQFEVTVSTELKRPETKDFPQDFREAIKTVNQVLTSEKATVRPRDKEGSTGGLIYLREDLPTLFISDLHARADYLATALLSGNRWRQFLEGKLQVVCLGDALHSENFGSWEDTIAEFNQGNFTGPNTELEMQNSFQTIELVMLLKALRPETFHYLRGNHDFLEEAGFSKHAEEGKQTKAYFKAKFGLEMYKDYCDFEKNLPLVAIGKNFVAMHAEPFSLKTGALEKEHLINSRLVQREYPEAFNAFFWARDQKEEIIRQFLTNLGKGQDSYLICGHTSRNKILEGSRITVPFRGSPLILTFLPDNTEEHVFLSDLIKDQGKKTAADLKESIKSALFDTNQGG